MSYGPSPILANSSTLDFSCHSQVLHGYNQLLVLQPTSDATLNSLCDSRLLMLEQTWHARADSGMLQPKLFMQKPASGDTAIFFMLYPTSHTYCCFRAAIRRSILVVFQHLYSIRYQRPALVILYQCLTLLLHSSSLLSFLTNTTNATRLQSHRLDQMSYGSSRTLLGPKMLG